MIDRRKPDHRSAAGGADEAHSRIQSAGANLPEDPRRAERLPTSVQLEVALYIESISAELSQMAQAADLEALQYFLEMARLEASIQVEKRAMQDPA